MGVRLIPQRNKKRMMIIIAVCVIIVLLLAIILCLRQCDSNEVKPPTTPTESDKTLDFIPAGDEESIRMPGYGGLIFNAGTLQQNSDLHNPAVNKCLFVFSLYLSDGTLIFKSDYVKPGDVLNEITLNQTLEKGLYRNCKLVIDCFVDNETKTQLNGSIQTIEIKTN